MTAKKKTITKVLQLKSFTQDQLEAEVRKANDRLNAEEERLEHLQMAFTKTEEKIKGCERRGPIQISEVGLFYDYLAFLRRQIGEQREVVSRVGQELELKKSEMLEVYREKRIFEKFRDNIVSEENRKVLHIEQSEADYDFISRKLRK